MLLPAENQPARRYPGENMRYLPVFVIEGAKIPSMKGPFI